MIIVKEPRDRICECCGAPATLFSGRTEGGGWRNARCRRHADRNPCLVEGCRRSRSVGSRYANDQWLCSEHWRRYVPPRSRLRRTYHRFWRLAKRHGWTEDLIGRFNRFWDGLVKRVQRQSVEGAIDEAEIRRMFGWDVD